MGIGVGNQPFKQAYDLELQQFYVYTLTLWGSTHKSATNLTEAHFSILGRLASMHQLSQKLVKLQHQHNICLLQTTKKYKRTSARGCQNSFLHLFLLSHKVILKSIRKAIHGMTTRQISAFTSVTINIQQQAQKMTKMRLLTARCDVSVGRLRITPCLKTPCKFVLS